MRVAIVHYHLKRGGVTRVVESTLRGFESLENPPQCVVLAGEVPDDCPFRECATTVKGLHYSNAQVETPDPQTLLRRIRTAAREALGGEPDLWHIHNHSLGKNSAMPGVVSLLATSGEAILLHMHDFAEDGRPENYRLNQIETDFSEQLYPHAPGVHYGVLNGRDHAIFSQVGIHPDRLHLLANPVEGNDPGESTDSSAIRETLGAQRLYLYPVRAVRRKNFGEMLLWAALADEGDFFATTLGPTNQNYVAAYERWQAFASEHKLPVHFGIGEKHDRSFEAIMHSADAILSTSIAEGFGLAYLEPWLFGKAITGRDLPEITADFSARGIQLDDLYDSLPVPAEWVDSPALRRALQDGLSAAYAAYERALPGDAVDRALAAISPAPDRIDFAGLNEALQETVIERVVNEPSAASALPRLEAGISSETIQRNAKTIAGEFNTQNYAANLSEIYTSIPSGDSTQVQFIDPNEVLDGFLKPERFRLLRT